MVVVLLYKTDCDEGATDPPAPAEAETVNELVAQVAPFQVVLTAQLAVTVVCASSLPKLYK